MQQPDLFQLWLCTATASVHTSYQALTRSLSVQGASGACLPLPHANLVLLDYLCALTVSQVCTAHHQQTPATPLVPAGHHQLSVPSFMHGHSCLPVICSCATGLHSTESMYTSNPISPSRSTSAQCPFLHLPVICSCDTGVHSTGSMYPTYPISPSRSTSAQVAPGVHAHRTSSYSSAGPTSAPASPTRIDGKEFFRQAR